MFTVALIGPDGAGKTTIGRRLEQTLPMPVKYMYMGDNPETSNFMLPTTRLNIAIKRALGAKPARGPRPHKRVKSRPKNIVMQTLVGLKSGLGLINRLFEEWFRQVMAWYYQWKGNIVLFDRHFFADYYAGEIANCGQRLPTARRIHGFVLAHIYPKPDLVIYLDAPSKVLLARKGEGTVDFLERRRQDYLHLNNVLDNFIVVDATQSEDEVVETISLAIKNFAEARSKAAFKLGV